MNLYDLGQCTLDDEKSDLLFHRKNIRIERIVSTGQSSPPGFWYDQNEDEWVLLVNGEAVIAYPDKPSVSLKQGDQLFLKAHEKHRVDWTSKNPACIWLCIFGQMTDDNKEEEKNASE